MSLLTLLANTSPRGSHILTDEDHKGPVWDMSFPEWSQEGKKGLSTHTLTFHPGLNGLIHTHFHLYFPTDDTQTFDFRWDYSPKTQIHLSKCLLSISTRIPHKLHQIQLVELNIIIFSLKPTFSMFPLLYQVPDNTSSHPLGQKSLKTPPTLPLYHSLSLCPHSN